MTQSSNIRYLVGLILIIFTPTALALGWFYYTKDPNLRPLGITIEALRSFEGAGAMVEIVATVDGIKPGTPQATRDQLRQNLETAFRVKGVDVRVVMNEGSGTPRVTYDVGKTTLGPYPTSRASEGIGEAVDAYRMHGGSSR